MFAVSPAKISIVLVSVAATFTACGDAARPQPAEPNGSEPFDAGSAGRAGSAGVAGRDSEGSAGAGGDRGSAGTDDAGDYFGPTGAAKHFAVLMTGFDDRVCKKFGNDSVAPGDGLTRTRR